MMIGSKLLNEANKPAYVGDNDLPDVLGPARQGAAAAAEQSQQYDPYEAADWHKRQFRPGRMN